MQKTFLLVLVSLSISVLVFSSQVTVEAANPTKVVIIGGAAQTLSIYEMSKIITVQLQDSSGNPAPAKGSGEDIHLSTNSSTGNGGSFTSDSSGSSKVNIVHIPPGSDSISFYYYDLAIGLANITASASNITSASTLFNVTNAFLSFSSGGSQTICSYGISQQITCQLQNAYNNPVNIPPLESSIEVALTSNSTGGTFYSDATGNTTITKINLSPGSNSTNFYYGDLKSGSSVLTATSTVTLSTATQFHVSKSKLTIISGDSQNVNIGVISSPITIELQNSVGNALSMPTSIRSINVNLLTNSTGSQGGSFYSDGGGTTKITTVQFSSASIDKIFYYLDSTTGTALINASGTEITPAITTLSIVTPPTPTPSPTPTSTDTPTQSTPTPQPQAASTTQPRTSGSTPTSTPKPTTEPPATPITLKANFTFSYPISTSSLTILFDASRSSTGSDNITSYKWNFGDGNTTTTSTNSVTHTYYNLQSYKVELTITDSSNHQAKYDSVVSTNNNALHSTNNSTDNSWIYAVVGAIGIIAVSGFIIIKKRNTSNGNKATTKTDRLPPGFPLRQILKGTELPEACSLMITGEANVEKGLLCEQISNYYLKQNKPVIYITYDRFPSEIRNDMKIHGLNIEESEKNGNFEFIDAYSALASKQSTEKYFLRQPFSLSELGISISSAINKFNGQSAKVFLDSANPLFNKIDCEKMVQFIQDRCALIKGQNSTFIFAVGTGIIQTNIHRKLEEIVDLHIELQTNIEKGTAKRKLLLKKSRSASTDNVELFVNSLEPITMNQ